MAPRSDPTRSRTRLGGKLLSLRTDRGLTQAELAAKTVGVSASYIGRLESGSSPSASVETVVNLAAALNCSSDEREALLRARDADAKSSLSATQAGVLTLDSLSAIVALATTQQEATSDRLRDTTALLGDEDLDGQGKRYRQALERCLAHLAAGREALRLLEAALSAHARGRERTGESVSELLDRSF
jgi:transcriptional regulator with XRE-family HTH domain